MGYIYEITNNSPNLDAKGKKYIGQTIQNINDRWRSHKNKDSNCVYLKRAFEKHGIENFTFRIICICFDDDLDKYEVEYIEKYNTIVPNGYNISKGGASGFSGCKHSDETKQKLSKISLAYFSNQDNLKKLSDSVIKGLENINISDKMLNSEKWKNAINDKEKWGNRKNVPIIQLDLENNEIAKFDGINEASRKTGVNKTSINKVINKKQTIAGGFKWIKNEILINENKNIKIVDKIPKNNFKAVIQYDLNNNKIAEYESILDIIDKNSEYKRGSLSANLNGRRKTAYGFIWKFDDTITKEPPRIYNESIKTREIMTNLKGKKIIQYEINGNVIKEYDSISQAARLNKFTTSGICKCLKNMCNTYKNFVWKYKNEENSEENNTEKTIINKNIIQYDSNNIFVNQFDSIREASRITSISRNHITLILEEKKIEKNGFTFKYNKYK